MRYIAHRGLFEGPDKEKENRPDQIELALRRGYDCEIDVWKADGKWFLGHDEPTYEVTFDFLCNDRFWIHCKNFYALNHFVQNETEVKHYFWHQEDNYTLTSCGRIWTYPGMTVSKNSIAVMPERNSYYWACTIAESNNLYGVCTDYVEKFINEARVMFVGTSQIV